MALQNIGWTYSPPSLYCNFYSIFNLIFVSYWQKRERVSSFNGPIKISSQSRPISYEKINFYDAIIGSLFIKENLKPTNYSPLTTICKALWVWLPHVPYKARTLMLHLVIESRDFRKGKLNNKSLKVHKNLNDWLSYFVTDLPNRLRSLSFLTTKTFEIKIWHTVLLNTIFSASKTWNGWLTNSQVK